MPNKRRVTTNHETNNTNHRRFSFRLIGILAQETIDPKAVPEKYDEISRLETRAERGAFLSKQTAEMRVALWNENVDRKTKAMNLSDEQKETLDVIRKKINTVEFFRSNYGKKEEDAGAEYQQIMNKALQLFGRETVNELFGILGESKTLKKEY